MNKQPSFWDIFGGTIKGVTEKLEYLQELGVTIIYFTPIFLSDSNHKYDTIDYLKLDPGFGTEDDLKELVNELHKRNMKLILDGVFNHSGSKFAPFVDVLEKQENSPYKDWFQIEKFPVMLNRGEKPNYGSFSYFSTMPQLNPENQEVREYVKKVIDYWMNNFNIDGWRLDVADEVTHSFWKFFRKAVKQNNPEAPIIGEVWYDATEWLLGDEFDTVMHYPFFFAMQNWIGEGDGKPSEFLDKIGRVRGMYQYSPNQMLWNLLDSHDCKRFLWACGNDKRKLKLAVIIQMTMTGTPMIYYGDEIGMTGGDDPDCRRGMIWEEDRQDKGLFEFYKRVIEIRKQSKALMNGELVVDYVNDNEQVLVYKKVYKTEEKVIIVNNSDKCVELSKYISQKNMLEDNSFNGIVKPFSGVILG